MRKFRSRTARLIYLKTLFILMTAVFVVTTVFISRSLKDFFYNLKISEAENISRSISSDLSHAGESVHLINELLNEKLLTTAKAVGLNHDNLDNKRLAELAAIFAVDEIYAYNTDGIIEYSASGKYVGWQIHPGHPAYEFMNSDKESMTEEIRKDSDSDLYYKYGYIKTTDGCTIQIGILAETVQEMLESFRLQSLLEKIIDDDVVELFAINNLYQISASTNSEILNHRILDKDLISQLENNQIYGSIKTVDGADVYQIYVPLQYKSEPARVVAVSFSLEPINPIIRKTTYISLAGLSIVYLALLIGMIANYLYNRRVYNLAYTDTLTKLPNRISLLGMLERDLEKGKHNRAVIIVRCENMDLINSVYGYEYGDLVFREIANRLKMLENKNLQAFKFTANNFVVYLKNYQDKTELVATLAKIKYLFERPLLIGLESEHLFIKIGVAEYTDPNQTAGGLLQNATLALNYSGSDEAVGYHFFDEQMELKLQREECIEDDIRAGLRDEPTAQLYPEFQPIVDTESNKITGFELLARLYSQELGQVSPLEFIAIAERKQLINQLSNRMLRAACAFIDQLKREGFGDISVAVNISAIHLLQDNFTAHVLGIVNETGVNGHNLELEITETILMENYSIVNERLKELRANGIRISIDDFGTGYSSFYRLNELNIDTLKIDRYFINDISQANKDASITRDIISMAHRLGLETVAEGVELSEQRDYLLEYECDKIQGFLFSKAVPKAEAIELLKKNA
ncbi:MAG: putative bifunctional diguanylate cyclase/phosphodiesterase [Christensenellales bacterium]|jgi:diguanylate cyclase (GGDEF)-like protein